MATILTDKTYIYRMYRGARFLGNLPNVTSQFNYALDINSTFTQISVEVGVSPDTAANDVSPLLDEVSGAVLLDEQGGTLYEEKQPDLFGNDNTNALVRNGNLIRVYEYSTDNPNGVIVFDGFVETYVAKYGDENKLVLTCLSNGSDLNEYIVQVGGYTSQFSQLVNNAADVASVFGGVPYQSVGQQLVTSGAFSLRRLSVYLSAYAVSGIVATLKIYTTDPSGTLLGTTSTTMPSSAGSSFVDFIFEADIPLGVGTYFFTVTTDDPTGFNYVASNGGPRVGGGAYLSKTSIPAWTLISGEDLIFNMYSSNSSTDSTFTSLDPTTILKQSIDNYVGQGGTVNYSSTSTDLTALTATYPFKVATVLEVIKKCLELAPYDWYVRVDPATNTIYFKQTATTATHTFIKGRHFSNFELTASIRDVRNLFYFSGGNVGGGVNLFTRYLSQTSITAIGRQKLERRSDNRVVVQATADLIGNSLLLDLASEQYSSPLTILATAYDISTIKPGQTVTVTGFNNFIDRMVQQIARVQYYPDRAELILGKLPPRQTTALAQAIGDLTALQTIANPSAPS